MKSKKRVDWRRRALWFLAGVVAASLTVPGWAAPIHGKRRPRTSNRRRGGRPTYGKGDERNRPTKGNPATESLLEGEHEFNECHRFPRGRRVKITLKPDSDIHDLVAWISAMTCKRFIIGSNIRAQKVTIYSPTPVTVAEAYRAFLSALNVMGLTVQPAGRYLKIVETRTKPLTTLCTPGRACPRDDRIVTRLVRLKYVSPEDVKPVLDGLKSRDGNVILYSPTNLVIITDVARNVAKLVRVLRYVDVPPEGGERVWVVRIKYAQASEMAQLLQEIFETKRTGSSKSRRKPPRYTHGKYRSPAKTLGSIRTVTVGGSGGVAVSKILADDRTNLLVIVADERSYLHIRALIRKLDIPVKGGEERIHVVPLANADAEEMAATLSGLVGGGYRGSRRTSRRTSRRSHRTKGRRGGVRGGAVSLFEGEVQITADTATNSLVIVASLKDFLSLKKVIDKLDVPRRQVFVEATIMEVSLSKTRDLGLAFHGGYPVGSGDERSLLLFGNNAAKSITLDPGSLMGLAIGLRGPELQDAESLLGIPGISFPTFGVFFQALQSNNDVNVISTPHILTTDNEEAVIEVGENVPFQAGISGLPGYAGALGAAGAQGAAAGGFGYFPMMSIQRQDVTLKLKIVPHVNESNYVRLEIEQEMNEVKSIDPIVGPTTTKKKIKTVIVLRDQQTAVLGGLITEKKKRNVTKIPILGDIPIIGYLFKSTKVVKEKSNLLIFLTPYIIRDQDDLRRIFRRKIEQRREFLEKYTAFKDEDLEAVIDYRHKWGLLEEINRVARLAEQEEEMKKKAMAEAQEMDVDGPVTVSPEDREAVERAIAAEKEAARREAAKKEKSGGGRRAPREGGERPPRKAGK